MRLIALLCIMATAVSTVSAAPKGFCATYAGATATKPAQYGLISAVVLRTLLGCNSVDPSASAGNVTCAPASNTTIVTGLIDVGSSNRAFFDGTGAFVTNTGSQGQNGAIAAGTGGSTKFVNVSANGVTASLNPAAGFLAQHLIEWFGRDLGCDVDATATGETTGIAVYGGVKNMTLIHKDMKIGKVVWDGFVAALVGSLKSYGVVDADISGTVAPYAATFLNAASGDNIICNQADCVKAPTTAPTQPPTGTTAPPTTAPTAKPNSTATAVAASPVIILTAITAAAMLL